MKSFRPVRYTFKRRNILLMGLLHFYISLSGQSDNLLLPDIFFLGYKQDNNLDLFEEDTSTFHLTQLRFQSEVSRKGYINLDTFRYYGHLSIDLSKRQNYYKGLIRTFIGFGSGYVEKNEIDSSLYYSRLAIQYATVINDTSLLSQAYLNAGWALLYKYRNEEGLENALSAYRLAKESKDTSMLILSTSKLGKIYQLMGQSFNQYKAYSESLQLCKDWRDTTSLMHNYFRLANLYLSMSLNDKYGMIVKEALQYEDHITDNEALYNLNYLLANWYNINEQYDSMLYYSRKLVFLAKKLNRIPMGLARIAGVYVGKNQMDSAKFYFDQLLLEKQNLGAYIDAHEYLDIGGVEFQLGNFQMAYVYFKKAEGQLDNVNTNVKQRTFRALYHYYDTLHQYTKAYTYLKGYVDLTDSIIQFQNSFKAGISLMEVESNALEEKIDLLSKNNELQTALASREKQQKNMVYGSTALLLMLTWIGFIKYRKQKDIKNKQTLMSDRLRISRELHDEVGATLSGIAMYSHVAKEQVKNSNIREAENSLSFMQKSAGEMVNKLSDIVWLINPEQDTILEIIGRLGEYGKQMASAKNMQMKLDVPSELTGLHIPFDARRNIYLICKEAINNAVKYSHGRFVELHVSMEGSLLSYLVLDDGNGFDMGTIKHGNGLINMKKRAEEIGANFQMESSPYTGTRIEIQYKLIH